MKAKLEAHETLSLVFQRDGVPPKIVVDNSKEHSLGGFQRKCRETDCHLVNIEPYCPWMMAAEGYIKKVKHDPSRKMLSTGTPKRLWDHAIEHKALICSHTVLDLYGLEG